MTQESPMGLGVEQRLRQLERNIEQTQVLLSRLEEALLYETHPIRQSGYENNIASLQQRIATYRREHSELGRLVTRDQVEQSNHISKELEDLQAGIDRILAEQRVIGRSIGQLQRDLADQFDARVQGALSTIVRRLDQSDLLTVTVIEHAIESATVPIAVMTDILQHVWIELSAIQDQTLAQDKELSDGIGKLAGIVNDPELSVSHKLKVTIPIIPFVMQYEGHVDIGSKLRLRAAWEKLVRHTSGGEP